MIFLIRYLSLIQIYNWLTLYGFYHIHKHTRREAQNMFTFHLFFCVLILSICLSVSPSMCCPYSHFYRFHGWQTRPTLHASYLSPPPCLFVPHSHISSSIHGSLTFLAFTSSSIPRSVASHFHFSLFHRWQTWNHSIILGPRWQKYIGLWQESESQSVVSSSS